MFPKGGMSKLLKQAQELQVKMENAKNELSQIKVEGSSGGGMVIVEANGKKEILSIQIDKEVISEDKEMLEDLIISAVNQALDNANAVSEEKVSDLTGGMMGGMKIPGM